MKLLNCIISYNRYYYLKNLIESLEEFFPYGDTIIIDDQSDDTNTTRYLNELCYKGVPVLHTTVEKSGPRHGGLYHAMDMGMQYAAENGYKYVNYLQDDLQCMWQDNRFDVCIERLFSSSEKVLCIYPMFIKRILSYQYPEKLPPYNDAEAYHFKPYAIGDIGVVDISRFRKLNVKFSDFSSANLRNEVIHKMGYLLLVPKSPIFAWIPWPEAHRYGKKIGIARPPVKKYYLKPISGKMLRRLKSRPISEIPYAETYCHTWGYLSLKPYWFSAPGPAYRRFIIKNLKAGKNVIPHFSFRL